MYQGKDMTIHKTKSKYINKISLKYIIFMQQIKWLNSNEADFNHVLFLHFMLAMVEYTPIMWPQHLCSVRL